MQSIATIGLDIAKSVSPLHGVDAAGQVVLRRQLKRRYVLTFFEKLTPCLVGIEACASSHHWSRELQALGHSVPLPRSLGSIQSSAGACVENWTQLNPPSHGSPCKIEIRGRKSMASFKQPDFIERQEAAAKARKVALEKFRAKAADPALVERLTARAARAAEHSAIKTTREIERAEKEAREAERAQRAERDAATEAERAKAESGERERALQVKQKAARDGRYAACKSRAKRRSVRPLHGT